MSSGRREGGKSCADKSDVTSESCASDTSSRELLGRGGVERCGVIDTRRTILSRDRTNHQSLDADVEADAVMSSDADEPSCFQRNDPTGYRRQTPALRANDVYKPGLQESVATTDSFYYVSAAAGTASSTAGETVRLMSCTGVTGNWNNTVVLPVNDQRSNLQSPPFLPAVSSAQVRTERCTQVSTDADEPARRAASRPSCCTQRWTLSVINR